MNLKHRNRSLAIALLGICGGVCGGLQAATITITSISDALNPGGGCTLRGAVAAVNAGADAHGCTATGSYGDNDTVIFSNTLAGQTVQFINEGLVIEKSLTIQGPTAAENDPRRRVTLRGVKVEEGEDSFHMLETHEETLTVRDLDFVDNTSWSSSGGSAIYAHDLTAVRCAFNNHTGSGMGGAISAESVDLDFCTFSDNTSDYHAGAIWVGHEGGTIKNSTFNRNSANYGGALGGNVKYVVNSTFSHNTADHGGAIDASVDIVISGSAFIGNTSGWYAGALSLSGQGSISNSVFSGNTARDSGGAIQGGGAIDINGSIFSGNSAPTGGAIYLSGNLTAYQLTFTDNTATSGPAVYAYSNSPYSESQANIVNSTFLGNNSNPHCAGGTYTGDYNYGWRSVGNGVSDQSCSRP